MTGQPDPFTVGEKNLLQGISDSARVELMVKRADSLERIGNLQESIALLKDFKPFVDSLGSAHLNQLLNIQLASDYLSYDQPDSAEKILKGMLEAYPESDKKARLLSLLGNAYRYQGRYEEALAKQDQARALIDSAQNPVMYSKINHNAGAIHESTGNLGIALKYYLRSINIAEAIGDSLLLANGLNSLGVAYNNKSEPEKAKYYLQRAIEINKSLNNRIGLLWARTNLAISLERLENFDQAIRMYDQALSLHNEIRKDTPPFRLLYNLGQLYRKTGDLNKAEEHYRQSLDYCQQAGIPQGLIYNYGGLANVAELRENYPKAEKYYLRALDVSRNIGMAQLEQMALQSLYHLEKNRKNYEQALSYHEKMTAISDSLKEVERKEDIEKTETNLGLRKQEEINRLLQEKQQQQEARIVTQNWLIAVSAGIIVVILISLYLLYRSNAEKKRINRELESQRNKLQELNKVKDKVLAIISHDLRSPLVSMHGMLYLLREEGLSQQEIREMASDLEVSINQNISMMDNLLAWAREQMTGMELDLATVTVRNVVDEVFDNCEFRAQYKGIKLKNEVSSKLKVKADFNLLSLILRNLITNSIKFSQKGDEITVRTKEEAGEIIFEVTDTGIGIPEEKQHTLFELNNEPRAGTENEKGSGLGLQLCKEFVEKQDGEIDVESTEGEGTTIKFSLPKAS